MQSVKTSHRRCPSFNDGPKHVRRRSLWALVEREFRGVCQASTSAGAGDVQTPSANGSARLGFQASFRPPNGAPRRRTGGKVSGSARARAAAAAVQVADFPRRPVCSARSRPRPLFCGYGDAGAPPCGLAFRGRRARPDHHGATKLVSPRAVCQRVLARSSQGAGSVRPTSSAYRSLATPCSKPRPQR